MPVEYHKELECIVAGELHMIDHFVELLFAEALEDDMPVDEAAVPVDVELLAVELGGEMVAAIVAPLVVTSVDAHMVLVNVAEQ